MASSFQANCRDRFHRHINAMNRLTPLPQPRHPLSPKGPCRSCVFCQEDPQKTQLCHLVPDRVIPCTARLQGLCQDRAYFVRKPRRSIASFVETAVARVLEVVIFFIVVWALALIAAVFSPDVARFLFY